MSTEPAAPAATPRVVRRRSVAELATRKRGGGDTFSPIICLTAYTAPVARALDASVDVLLVGDSVGMVLYGMPSTLAVTLEMMIAHARAVVGASARACVVADLPFGSYQQSPAQAFASAARLLAESGAQAVKLEGGEAMAETVQFLVRRGVPVMGHVGLMPQSALQGGYGARGRLPEQAEAIRRDARAIAQAGAFSLVLEGTVEPLARQVAQTLPIPVIGIGASAACDGQVLVTEDMVGLSGPRVPKFVRRYADLGAILAQAAADYAADIRAGRFPGPEEIYAANPDGADRG